MTDEDQKSLAFACATENGHQPGMTLWQYYAGAALQGLLANRGYSFGKGDDVDEIITDVVEITDAMMKMPDVISVDYL